MNRFNLTFRGEFLPGQDRERAKLRFAQLFGIDDRTRLDSFFSGRTVILRRNLDRKTAAEYYAKLRELGVHAQLVKVSAPEAANTALRKAENEKRAAERKVARQQAQREAAQQAERERAERGEQQRIAVQQAAQRKAERAERKQQEAREAARRQEQERRRAAEQAAQRAAERERRAAQHREQAAQRRAMEEQAISRGAQALSRQVALKPVSARVKTRLETPRGADRAHDHSDPGAPNLYALQPFRNTPAVRERAAQARQRLRRAVVVAFVASAALLLLAGAYLQRATAPPDMRIAASAVEPGSGPLLLVAGRLLRHDRSGRGTQTIALRDMGLATLQAPLVFDATGYLLAPGRLAAGDPAAAGDASARLLRCDLDQRKCRPVSGELDGRHISGLALHPLSGDLFVADAGAGRIVRIGADGQRLGQAAVPLVQHPALRLAAGLLFTNSVNGPAISVFRYDAAAFGQQLDEILLLPAAMAITEHTRVRDFIRVDGDWWVILYTADPGAATPEGGVFRFDAQGKYLGRIDGPPHSRPRQLLNWAGKVLIRDADATTLQRFSAAGTPEAPLRSDLLQHLHAREQRAAALTALAWHTALIVLLLLTLGAAGTAYLQRARSLVYKSKRERGAEPIDAIAASVRWLPSLADRQRRLARTAAGYGLVALVLLALGIAARISSAHLLAALLALSGPAAALWLLYRGSPGHIGTAGGQLVLVDHRGVYHFGADARLLHRGPFLMIDDVVLFSGNCLLPAFPSRRLREQVAPLVGGGIRVDRKTVAVRLLQSRHPLAVGAAATLAAVLLALLVLCVSAPF